MLLSFSLKISSRKSMLTIVVNIRHWWARLKVTPILNRMPRVSQSKFKAVSTPSSKRYQAKYLLIHIHLFSISLSPSNRALKQAATPSRLRKISRGTSRAPRSFLPTSSKAESIRHLFSLLNSKQGTSSLTSLRNLVSLRNMTLSSNWDTSCVLIKIGPRNIQKRCSCNTLRKRRLLVSQN